MKTFDFTRRNESGEIRNVGRMTFRAAAGNAPAKLEFYGDIVSADWACWGDSDACPTGISDILAGIDNDAPLDVYFNSGGGDVYAGIAIYNLLMRHTGAKHGYVDGMCASIASVILMACDDITVNAGAEIMIHNPWTFAVGNAAELRGVADRLDGVRDRMVDIYEGRAAEGVSREDIAAKMDAETWLDGNAAAEVFANVCAGTARMAALAASAYYAHYRNAPSEVTRTGTAPAGNPGEGDGDEMRAIIGDLYLYGSTP